MTDTKPDTKVNFVSPDTAEVLLQFDLSAPLEQKAADIDRINLWIEELKQVKARIDEAGIADLDRENKRSLTIGDFDLKTQAPEKTEWDEPYTLEVLNKFVEEELITADARERVMPKVVTETYKLSVAEINKLMKRRELAERLQQCFRMVPNRRYLSVKRRGRG